MWYKAAPSSRYIAALILCEVLRNPVSLRNRVSGAQFIQLITDLAVLINRRSSGYAKARKERGFHKPF
jgi:hypothetical protein